MNLQLQKGKIGNWMITTSDPSLVNKGFSEVREGIYVLHLPPECLHMYSGYKRRMYCIYAGYKYSIETIIGDLAVFYPEEKKTRRALGLHIHDDSRLKVFFVKTLLPQHHLYGKRERLFRDSYLMFLSTYICIKMENICVDVQPKTEIYRLHEIACRRQIFARCRSWHLCLRFLFMLLLFFGELGALHAEVSEPDSLRVERIGGFDAEKLEHSFGLVRFRSSAQARYALDLGKQFSKDLSRPNFNINNLRWIFDGKKIQAKDLQRLRGKLDEIVTDRIAVRHGFSDANAMINELFKNVFKIH